MQASRFQMPVVILLGVVIVVVVICVLAVIFSRPSRTVASAPIPEVAPGQQAPQTTSSRRKLLRIAATPISTYLPPPIPQLDKPAVSGPVRLVVELLEEGTERPLPRVSIWLKGVGNGNVRGFTDAHGRLVRERIPAGVYRADAKLGELPPVDLGEINFLAKGGEEVFTLHHPAIPRARFQLQNVHGQPLSGVAMVAGYVWLPETHRRDNMPIGETGLFTEATSDSNGMFEALCQQGLGDFEIRLASSGGLLSFVKTGDWTEVLLYSYCPAGQPSASEINPIYMQSGTIRFTGVLIDPPALAGGQRFQAHIKSPSIPRGNDVPVNQNSFTFQGTADTPYILQVGRWDIELKSYISVDANRSVRAPVGTTEFRFEIPMRGDVHIDGLVETPSGKPIEGVALMVVSNRQEKSGMVRRLQMVRSSTSNTEGHFEVDVFEADGYRFTLASDSLAAKPYSLPEPVEVAWNQLENNGGKVVIQLRPKGLVWGQVLNPDGSPAADAGVRILRQDLTLSRDAEDVPRNLFTQTDADGIFQIDAAAQAGTGRWIAVATGSNGQQIAFADVTADAEKICTLTLAPAGSVSIPMRADQPGTQLSATFQSPTLTTPVTANLLDPTAAIPAIANDESTAWQVSGLPLDGTEITVQPEGGSPTKFRIIPDPSGQGYQLEPVDTP